MKKLCLLLLGAGLGIAMLPYVLFRQLEMPAGASLRSPDFTYQEARLLIDRTAWNEGGGAYVRSHTIFNAMLQSIAEADRFIIADFFLWNPWLGAIAGNGELRPLANELADALIAKRIQNPNMPILVLTDPVNRIYGNLAPALFDRMAEAGIPVVFTDLSQLPDSNLVYAPQAWFWSKFMTTGEDKADVQLFSNPFDSNGGRLNVAQLSSLLHFKANHRKVLVTGEGADAHVIVASLNPADGSANHSNLAMRVNGEVARFAARSELTVASWSAQLPENIHGGYWARAAGCIEKLTEILAVSPEPEALAVGQASVAWCSEGAIRDELIAQLKAAGVGSRIDVAVFYLSERKVIHAIKGAVERGATLRLLLDANRDAFGREKNGVPNRPVAAELMQLRDQGGAVTVRWAATHGEQYHAKVLRIIGPGQDLLLLGSANWTRRNIANFNLEANLLLENSGQLGGEFDQYFESVWSNARGFQESQPYEVWAEHGWALMGKTWLYRIQEWSGFSTF